MFSTTFDDLAGKYSAFYAQIESNVAAAGGYWNQYFQGKGSLEVVIKFSNTGPTLLGGSLATSFLRKNGTLDVYEQGAMAELRTGIDPNGASSDIEINFNPDYLLNELWFDPNPSTRTTPVPTTQIDAMSMLLHEFGHAFGFNGWRDDTTGTLPSYQSTFDEQTIFDGTNFFFTGTKATAIYGSAVPLTFGNITHLGNNLSRPGSDLIPDLMNGVVFDRGTRYSISLLDLAILADTGISIVAPPPPVPAIPLVDFKKDSVKYMGAIRDYDGNNLGGASSWRLLGDVDIQGDGDLESILVNPAIGRFASVGSVNGNVDFTKHGLKGDTRVVGIYIDPTLKDKPENIGGPFDSQRRFQNDLSIDNLKVLAVGDYNNDGFQDLYFKLGDGSAVLRALMFKDGNIQYANYQSKTDLAAFMTANNVSSSIWGSWL
jgi:hypothetical protein